MGGASFEAVAGRLGVGAIAFFGFFLIADGLVPVFPLIESIGHTTTWGIIAVLPTVVVSYIVGVVCLEFAELGLSRFRPLSQPPPADAILVSNTGSGLLSQMYSEQLRNHLLLKGSSVSFVVLSLGCLAESRSLGGFTSLVWLFALSAAALAALSLAFAAQAKKHTQEIADAARANLCGPSNSALHPTGAGVV